MKKIGSALRAILGAIVLALLLGAVVGPAAAVELAGRVAPGEVVAKHEEVSMRRAGWSRRIYLEVRYRPADTGAPELAQIDLDPRRYDQSRVGMAVEVRHLPQAGLRSLGTLAAPRMADQPAFGPLRSRLAPIAGWLGGLAGGLLLLAAWARWRRWWLLLPLAAALLGAGLYAVGDWPGPAPAGPQLAATAVVRDTHEVTRFFRQRQRSSPDLAQPYTIVELAFTPQGAADPVVAVDQVDQGSVPGLAPGAEVPIRYSAADPRQAQIAGAARSYPWRNLASYAVPAVVILALLLAAGWGLRRARAARRGAARP